MVSPALVPDPACLHLLSLEAKGQTILMDVVSCALITRCPLCQRPSERVHSSYRRWVADLPWANLAVQVCLHVRRYISRQSRLLPSDLHRAASYGRGPLWPQNHPPRGTTHGDWVCVSAARQASG
jgi:hypothetical protein